MIDFLQESAVKEKLQAECLMLEAEANIVQAMTLAREGRFIPLGIDGEECSTAAYLADEYDHFREHARDAYFSVQDMELRKKLIHAQRRLDQHILRVLEFRIVEARNELAKANAKAEQRPWMKTVLVVSMAVTLGYWNSQLVGAIAGAVFGLFLVQSIIANAGADARYNIKEATEILNLAENNLVEHLLYPETFALREELSGIRSNELDRESAYLNVIQHESGG